MIGLYMDENVRGSITRGLLHRDVDVLTVQMDQRSGAADPQLLARATELGRPLYTEDDDLLQEAAGFQRAGERFAGVIYAQQTVAIGHCVDDLELIASIYEPHELTSRVLYLPLR